MGPVLSGVARVSVSSDPRGSPAPRRPRRSGPDPTRLRRPPRRRKPDRAHARSDCGRRGRIAADGPRRCGPDLTRAPARAHACCTGLRAFGSPRDGARTPRPQASRGGRTDRSTGDAAARSRNTLSDGAPPLDNAVGRRRGNMRTNTEPIACSAARGTALHGHPSLRRAESQGEKARALVTARPDGTQPGPQEPGRPLGHPGAADLRGNGPGDLARGLTRGPESPHGTSYNASDGDRGRAERGGPPPGSAAAPVGRHPRQRKRIAREDARRLGEDRGRAGKIYRSRPPKPGNLQVLRTLPFPAPARAPPPRRRQRPPRAPRSRRARAHTPASPPQRPGRACRRPHGPLARRRKVVRPPGRRCRLADEIADPDVRRAVTLLPCPTAPRNGRPPDRVRGAASAWRIGCAGAAPRIPHARARPPPPTADARGGPRRRARLPGSGANRPASRHARRRRTPTRIIYSPSQALNQYTSPPRAPSGRRAGAAGVVNLFFPIGKPPGAPPRPPVEALARPPRAAAARTLRPRSARPRLGRGLSAAGAPAPRPRRNRGRRLRRTPAFMTGRTPPPHPRRVRDRAASLSGMARSFRDPVPVVCPRYRAPRNGVLQAGVSAAPRPAPRTVPTAVARRRRTAGARPPPPKTNFTKKPDRNFPSILQKCVLERPRN